MQLGMYIITLLHREELTFAAFKEEEEISGGWVGVEDTCECDLKVTGMMETEKELQSLEVIVLNELSDTILRFVSVLTAKIW